MRRTNSSCSLTKRNFRALPRSDRTREGVDIGVRPVPQRLLCAGELVNVIGENAIPTIDDEKAKEMSEEMTSIFARCSSRCKWHLHHR